MNCQEVNRLLVAYLDNEVTPSERTLIQEHLAGCDTCQQELAALSALQSRVSQFLQVRAAQAAPSPQAWSRLQARLARKARPSLSWLPAWLQRSAPGVGRTNRIFGGGVTMKRLALAAIAVLVIAAGAVALIPSVRAQIVEWFRARWEFPGGVVEIGGTNPGYTVLYPSYLPDAIVSGNQMLNAGMMSADGGTMSDFFGDPDGQWLQVTQGPAPADRVLPAGQEVTIGGQKGVLITGLSGTLELSPGLPEDVEGIPPEHRPPSSFAYQNAQRLVWYVGDTRIELLSNLPVEEVLKVAESFRPAETGEGDFPMPEGMPPIPGDAAGGGAWSQGIAPGTPAPSFSLLDTEGRTVSLHEFSGQRLLLVFSATDCPHCRAMYPILRDFHKAHPDLPVLMISRGSEEENRRLVQDEGFAFPVLAWQDDVAEAYQVKGVPFFCLIDGQGAVANTIQGAVTPEQLEALVRTRE